MKPRKDEFFLTFSDDGYYFYGGYTMGVGLAEGAWIVVGGCGGVGICGNGDFTRGCAVVAVCYRGSAFVVSRGCWW